MRITESECVDCGKPCVGISCQFYKVERLYCDDCGEEEDLFSFDNQELCLECIKKRLTPIT